MRSDEESRIVCLQPAKPRGRDNGDDATVINDYTAIKFFLLILISASNWVSDKISNETWVLYLLEREKLMQA